MKPSEVAKLARDEHEERESRRQKKRRLRGHAKAAPVPRTIRAHRAAENIARMDDPASESMSHESFPGEAK